MKTATGTDEERRAWEAYASLLRGLTGEEYERAEREAWERLQARLRSARGEPEPHDDPVG